MRASMRRPDGRAWLLVLAVSGCGNSPASGVFDASDDIGAKDGSPGSLPGEGGDTNTLDQAAASDGSTDASPPIDRMAPVDAAADVQRPVSAIQCGNVACTLYDSRDLVCCSTDLGVTGTCVPFPVSCSQGRFDCGGAENCVSTASCCYFQGGSACIPGDCSPYQALCHGTADCDGGACCPLARGSSFRICTGGACP
jgi:hypothetical protein